MDGTCTTCGKAASPACWHPNIGAALCQLCSTRIETVASKKGEDQLCLWCCQTKPSYELLSCIACPEKLCRDCICRNFGAPMFKRMKRMAEAFRCCYCDRDSFKSLCRTVDLAIHESSKVHGRARRFVICQDISKGLENIEIPVLNEVDSEKAPSNFVYITQNVLGANVKLTSNNPNFLSCCSCTDNCSDPRTCECALLMAGFAYDKDGRFASDKPSGVYECNYLCSCHKDLCRNRTVGNGPRIPLEVFRCAETGKGWGVRCRVDISIGTFVTDYLGEVLNEADAEMRVEADEYLFGMDAFARSHACQVLEDVGLKKIDLPPMELASNASRATMSELSSVLGQEVASRIINRPKICSLINYETQRENKCSRRPPDMHSTAGGGKKRNYNNLLEAHDKIATNDRKKAMSKDDDAAPTDPISIRKKQLRDARVHLMERAMAEVETKSNTYTLDANKYGNVSRFLNHSCTPNLEKITVFSDSQDVRLPRISFFSNQFIPARTELCYDYGYFQGNVEGKHRKCLCGSEKCRGDMY